MLEISFSPFPEIKTQRLLLRCITKSDAPELFKMRSDPEVMQWLDREPFKELSEAEDFIETKILANLQKNDGILWVIALAEEPEILIGTTGFWRLDKEHYRAEIGYMLKSEFWRKGIAKEAIIATLDWCFTSTQIHSIEANINPENIGSAKVLESAGFVQEAHFKENYYFNGVFKDTIIYSLVRPKTAEK